MPVTQWIPPRPDPAARPEMTQMGAVVLQVAVRAARLAAARVVRAAARVARMAPALEVRPAVPAVSPAAGRGGTPEGEGGGGPCGRVGGGGGTDRAAEQVSGIQ